MDIESQSPLTILTLMFLIGFINRFMSRWGAAKSPLKEFRYIFSMSWVSGMLSLGSGAIAYGVGHSNPYFNIGISIFFGLAESQLAMRIFTRFVAKNALKLTTEIASTLEDIGQASTPEGDYFSNASSTAFNTQNMETTIYQENSVGDVPLPDGGKTNVSGS